MAEVEGGKGKDHICPHLQEDEGFEAGVVVTCSMTTAEGMLTGAEAVAGVLAEAWWSLAGGVEAEAQQGVV